MQSGPVRHKVDARVQALRRGIEHRARLRPTLFQLPPGLRETDRPSISAIYAALAHDEPRNALIFDDVLLALEAGRSPVVLTERLDTLFLTMPISWKGTLAQYVGRLHRPRQGKHDVLVYDYTDNAVPVLDRMGAKRHAGYRGAWICRGVVVVLGLPACSPSSAR